MAGEKIKKFAGLRNDVSSERFEPGDLEAAVNVDIDDSGRLSRRGGVELKRAGVTHSIWAKDDLCLFVEGGALKQLNPDYTAFTLRADVGSNAMSYERVNGRTYYSNGTVTGVVSDSGSRTWGLEVPGLPQAAQAGGYLPSGDYQFVMTYLREDGQESGAGIAGLITVTDGGIVFSDIPVSSDPTVSHKALYVTPQNGDVLYRAALLLNDVMTYTWAGGALALPLDTQYLGPPPAGSIVAFHGGSMYVVVGANVFYSPPFSYELFDPRSFLPFDSPVQVFAPVDGGIWVGTQTEVAWLAGESPDKLEKTSLAATPSLAGTLAYVQAQRLYDAKDSQADALAAVWWSGDGVCVGHPDGRLVIPTRERYRPAVDGVRGAGLVRQTECGTQYLAAVQH